MRGGVLLEIQALDNLIFEWIYGLPHNSVLDFLAHLLLGWYLVLILFLFLKGKKWRKTAVQCLALNLVLVVLNSLILKNIFRRARPATFCPASDWPHSKFSFPSGHGVRSMGTAVLVGLRHGKKSWLLLVMALLSGLARIYVGAHYPSDILVSWIEGALVAWVLSRILG